MGGWARGSVLSVCLADIKGCRSLFSVSPVFVPQLHRHKFSVQGWPDDIEVLEMDHGAVLYTHGGRRNQSIFLIERYKRLRCISHTPRQT